MRFKFGDNWSNFLGLVNESRVSSSKESLKKMLGIDDLKGKSVLDIGSGSGLTSLAARQLGANVVSFDYDKASVECTKKLRDSYYPLDEKWSVSQGSVLDDKFMSSIGDFDVVISWGVLHHTGDMWKALENVYELTEKNEGILYIALYNDQGFISSYWRIIKKLYHFNRITKYIVIVAHYPYLVTAPYIVRKLTGRGTKDRGMSLWYDLLDWVGGYPFEVVSIDRVKSFFSNDYKLINFVDVGKRHGCNEFVFQRKNKLSDSESK
jgi:2-polyprenyl-3-methyl-5-hydroxy-6-metoxy-1,4-benzoquinol methylase